MNQVKLVEVPLGDVQPEKVVTWIEPDGAERSFPVKQYPRYGGGTVALAEVPVELIAKFLRVFPMA